MCTDIYNSPMYYVVRKLLLLMTKYIYTTPLYTKLRILILFMMHALQEFCDKRNQFLAKVIFFEKMWAFS